MSDKNPGKTPRAGAQSRQTSGSAALGYGVGNTQIDEETRKQQEKERQEFESTMLEKQGKKKSLERSPTGKITERKVGQKEDDREHETDEESKEGKSKKQLSEAQIKDLERRERMRERRKQLGADSATTSDFDSEAEAKKRKRDEEYEARPTPNMDDHLEGIIEEAEYLRSILKTQAKTSKNISKAMMTKVEAAINIICLHARLEKLDRAKLQGIIEGRQEVIKMIAEAKKVENETVAETRVTYAERVKQSGGVKIKRPGRESTAKVILIKKEGMESEQVKEVVKRVIDPTKMELKVRKVGKIRNGIMMEVEGNENKDKIMKSELLVKEGLSVEEPRKKLPKLMIYDVEKGIEDKELVRQVYEGNGGTEIGISEEEFEKRFKVKFKLKQREGRGQRMVENVIVECDGVLRDWIRGKPRLYIGWNSCRAKDYVDLARCYKCQRYGHVARYCKNEATCGFCAGEHETRTCGANRDSAKCVNCSREDKKDSGHPAMWRNCPVFVRTVKQYFDKVRYD